MAFLFQVAYGPNRPPGSETISRKTKTPSTPTGSSATPGSPREIESTSTTAGKTANKSAHSDMVMGPSQRREISGETVSLGKLKMPPPPKVWDPNYDDPIYDPYYDDPNYGKSPARQNQTASATTPGRQTPSIQNRVDQGLSLVQGADGLMYLINTQNKTAAGVVRSINQLYGATNTVSSLLNAQGLSNFLRNAGPYAGMGLGAAALFTGQGWNSFQGAAGNVNTGLQITQQGLRHFTSAGAGGLTTATQMAGGVMGGIGAYYSAKELFSLWSSGTMSGTNMLRAGAAAFGLTMGVGAAAATTAGLIGGSSFLTGLSTTLALSGWGAPIAGAIIATTAVVMWMRSRKINQTNKVDDSVLTELRKGGIENLGNEKYRSDDKWKEVFAAADEFKKQLPNAKDDQGRPLRDANGQPYTMESFKNAPPAERMKIREAVAKAVVERIDSGALDSPGANEKDKQAARDRMFMVAASMASATRDLSEILNQSITQAPPQQRQALFNQYVEAVTRSTREVTGDKNANGANGKMDQGYMKRPESTKTQWDWMQVEFAQKAAELGVQFAPDWATPPVDQKKYQELKNKANKKGFDKLEGGEKLDIMKFEMAQKSQGQPMRFGSDNLAGNSVPQAQQMQVDPYAQYVPGQPYPGSQPQRVSTTPRYRDF